MVEWYQQWMMMMLMELHHDVHYDDVYNQQQQLWRDIDGKGVGLHNDVQHMEEGDGLSP